MVELDTRLLSDACQLLNESNMHRLGAMLLAYEEAVDFHNRQRPTHEIYRMQSELRLRDYVSRCQDEDRQKRTLAAIERANKAQSFFSARLTRSTA